jgi:hypothetical protein
MWKGGWLAGFIQYEMEGLQGLSFSPFQRITIYSSTMASCWLMVHIVQ